MKRAVIFALLFGSGILFAFSGDSVAQQPQNGQPIAQADYFASVLKSREDAELLVRRLTVKEYGFANGKKNLREEKILEYSPPDSHRFVTKKTVDAKITTTEEIKLGSSLYCRKLPDAWAKVEKWCPHGSDGGFGAMPDTKLEEFSKKSMGNGSDRIDVFRRYYSYADDLDAKSTWFKEDQFWIDAVGRIKRSESKSGVIGEKSSEKWVLTEYEYEPMTVKIKIEAPIK
jgi:hypothetical protein